LRELARILSCGPEFRKVFHERLLQRSRKEQCFGLQPPGKEFCKVIAYCKKRKNDTLPTAIQKSAS
jgi:hypothetical protein